MRIPSVCSYYIYWEEWEGIGEPVTWHRVGFPEWEETVGQGQGAKEAPPLLPTSFSISTYTILLSSHSPHHRDDICAIHT